jgi:glycosyltransferase involved in cell wall biosynthesis
MEAMVDPAGGKESGGDVTRVPVFQRPGVLPLGTTGVATTPVALGARVAGYRAFSLVISTIGRSAQIDLLFCSLRAQTFKDFEVIVVDQNKDDRVRSICDRFGDLDILYMTSPPGASKGRNVGLEYACGDIVAFPDDDCVYTPCVLERVKALIDGGVADFVMATSVDIADTSSALRESVETKQRLHAKRLGKYSLWFRGTTYTVFLTRPYAISVGAFDQRMGGGSGTPYGSGEDADYIVRSCFAGARMVRSHDVRIHHPPPDYSDSRLAEKAYTYGVGRRLVLEKHDYGPIFITLNVLWPVVHCLCNIGNGKRRYFMQMLKGRTTRPAPEDLPERQPVLSR